MTIDKYFFNNLHNVWGEYLQTRSGILNLINLANTAYRTGVPIMTDEQYDSLVEMYGEEPPIDDHDINADVPHAVPMLSQQKTYEIPEVVKQARRWDDHLYHVSYKLDGFAVSLLYEEGVLTCASTRGDGSVGKDITKGVVEGCFNVPITIPRRLGERVEFRGEIVMPKDLAEGDVSPRSLIVGAFKRNDPTEIHMYQPRFYAWDVITPAYSTMAQVETFCLAAHVNTVPYSTLVKLPALADVVHSFEVGYRNGKLDVIADGVVIRCCSKSRFNELGFTKHHPKGSIAYKFAQEECLSVVREIKYTVGETGKEGVVAIIDPVTCGGATISKVSIGSANVLEQKGICVGTKVLVERRGGVIPFITRVIN